MTFPSTRALACAFVLTACGKKEGEPTVVTQDERQAIEPADPGDLDSFAAQVESLVVAGDIAGLEGLWLMPDHLEGCEVKGAAVTKEKMNAFAEENLVKFRTDAAAELAENRSGQLLHTNRWKEQKPSYLGGRLEGEGCQAKFFGRINVIVKPTSPPPKVIEHRFNAQLIAGEWRLYRYLPTKPNCESAKDKGSIGCKKLAEQG